MPLRSLVPSSVHPVPPASLFVPEENFKKVQEAYSILSDPQERAFYDRTGRVGSQGPGGQGAPFDFGGDPAEMFSELFGQFFGGQFGGRRQSNRGDDIRVNVRVSFTDAAFGTEAAIKVPGMSYQPPLIGSRKILNFTAHSWPGIGSLATILAFLAGAAVALGEVRSRRAEGRS